MSIILELNSTLRTGIGKNENLETSPFTGFAAHFVRNFTDIGDVRQNGGFK